MYNINLNRSFHGIFAVVFVSALFLFSFNNPGTPPEEVTVTGEVLDLSCFMKSGAKGPDHKSCAAACISKGNPIGLLSSDGKAYLLLEDHQNAKPYEAIKGMAAETVTVTGTFQERNGLPGIVLAKVEAKK